jgi:hypothetical protein
MIDQDNVSSLKLSCGLDDLYRFIDTYLRISLEIIVASWKDQAPRVTIFARWFTLKGITICLRH